MNYMMMFPPHGNYSILPANDPVKGPWIGGAAGPIINQPGFIGGANGSTYTATGMGVGVPILLADVPGMTNLGWYTNHATGNGPSTQRPTGVVDGTQWRDDTLSATITWTGGTSTAPGAWRNASGVIV